MVECEYNDSPALSAYLDGALDGGDRSHLETHLKTCGACEAELARLRQLDAALAEAVAPDLSAEPGEPYWEQFTAGVLARTLTDASPPVSAARPWRRLLGAASLAAAMLAGLLLHPFVFGPVPAPLVENHPKEIAKLPPAPEPLDVDGIVKHVSCLDDGEVLELHAKLYSCMTPKQRLAVLDQVKKHDVMLVITDPDAQAPKPSLLDRVEDALAQLQNAESLAQFAELQTCLYESDLSGQIAAACKTMNNGVQKQQLAGLNAALLKVLKVESNSCTMADLTKIRRALELEKLERQLYDLRSMKEHTKHLSGTKRFVTR